MRVASPWFALGITLIVASSARAETAQVTKLPHEIDYKAPLNPGAPPAALIYGDNRAAGLYVTRVRFPPGFKVMPHFHPDERTMVILSGTLYVGMGEQWDEGKMKAFPAGSFVSEPPKAPHFTWAKDGEVIIQVTGYGPSGSTIIPQKQ